MHKIGLCLSGGGAKGAYQIGVLEAFKEKGIFDTFTAMSGTSIGAANISILSSRGIDVAKEIWFNLPDNSLVKEESFREKLKKYGMKAFDKGIYTMDTFQQVMINQIDFENLNNKECYVTISEIGIKEKGLPQMIKASFDHYIMKKGKAHYIPLHTLSEEDCMKVITASCSIPVAFPPVIKEEKKYVDGGLYDNTPVHPLVDSGCEEIYIIDIGFIKQPVNYKKKYPNIKFHIIKPSKRIGSVLNFDKEHAKNIFSIGYQDGLTFISKMDI